MFSTSKNVDGCCCCENVETDALVRAKSACRQYECIQDVRPNTWKTKLVTAGAHCPKTQKCCSFKTQRRAQNPDSLDDCCVESQALLLFPPGPGCVWSRSSLCGQLGVVPIVFISICKKRETVWRPAQAQCKERKPLNLGGGGMLFVCLWECFWRGPNIFFQLGCLLLSARPFSWDEIALVRSVHLIRCLK